MANIAVLTSSQLLGLALLIASWTLNGKAAELCNLAALSLFAFGIGWYLAGKRKGGDGE